MDRANVDTVTGSCLKRSCVTAGPQSGRSGDSMRESNGSYLISRRELFKETPLLGAAVAAVRSSSQLLAGGLPQNELPKIKLGKLEVSRLILGSNPFFGFAHGNPQASAVEMRAYYTDARVMSVLDAAASQGITAVWTPCYPTWIRLWNEYQDRGGKLKIWIGQPDAYSVGEAVEDPNFDYVKKVGAHISVAAKNGAKAICIQGGRVDEQFRAGRIDVVRDWLELIKSYGLPAGLASHGIVNHLMAEEKDLPTDFYHQTLYRPDNYIPGGLEESLATIAKLDKPVVAYKVLGAGRILPKDTFPYVLRRLKPKDGICVGAFPRDKDELAENAGLTRKASEAATAST
jgi:hypothetical protein